MTRSTLQSAIRAAIKGLTPEQAVALRKAIDVPAWSRTYGVPQKAIREGFESALNTVPPNSIPAGDGK